MLACNNDMSITEMAIRAESKGAYGIEMVWQK